MSAPTPGRPARRLTLTLGFIGLVQLLLGLAFLLAPARAAALLGLAPAPGWADWLLGMMAARCLGYAAGMFLAARRPREHAAWIATMVGIQAVDWIVTLLHLGQGDVTLRQVTTAAFFPVLFIALLLLDRRHWLPPVAA
jgi:hypothetical protein